MRLYFHCQAVLMHGGSVDSKEGLITSAKNDRIKAVVKLWDRRYREETGLFLIEGYRELMRAAEGGVSLMALYYCPSLFLGSNEQHLIQRFYREGAQLFHCAEEPFRKMSYRDRPDGLIGIASQRHASLQELEPMIAKSTPPFLIVAEAIEKPGNLGTILRSADAVGVDGCIICDRCTDVHNPNVVRASVGTLFTVPVIEAGGDETIRWLKEHDIAIVAATPSAEKLFTSVDMRGPTAIVVGTEQLGLSEKWMNVADIKVRIPMKGAADSLNVATATTLLLYEVVRQRSLG